MTTTTENAFVLAGDIGGTKTNLGLFSENKDRPEIEVMETFSSSDAPDLEHIIRKFLHMHPEVVSRACFGIAGPVIGGKSKTTNLPWRCIPRSDQETIFLSTCQDRQRFSRYGNGCPAVECG